jgi:hypothetical protein
MLQQRLLQTSMPRAIGSHRSLEERLRPVAILEPETQFSSSRTQGWVPRFSSMRNESILYLSPSRLPPDGN